MKQKTLLELCEEVSEELNIDVSIVKHVLNYIINDVRREISKGSSKEILIHNFGTFTIPKNSINKFREKLIKAFELNNITEAKFKKGMKNLNMLEERK